MAPVTRCVLLDAFRAAVHCRKPGAIRHRITQPIPDDPVENRRRDGLQLESLVCLVPLCEL
jgi:hypothetical protein